MEIDSEKAIEYLEELAMALAMYAPLKHSTHLQVKIDLAIKLIKQQNDALSKLEEVWQGY